MHVYGDDDPVIQGRRRALREEVARRCREARLDAGLTQNEVVKKTGVSLRTLARLEAGVWDPDLVVLGLVAEACELPFNRLIPRELPVVKKPRKGRTQ